LECKESNVASGTKLLDEWSFRFPTTDEEDTKIKIPGQVASATDYSERKHPQTTVEPTDREYVCPTQYANFPAINGQPNLPFMILSHGTSKGYIRLLYSFSLQRIEIQRAAYRSECGCKHAGIWKQE
jgi:hypothetical protein